MMEGQNRILEKTEIEFEFMKKSYTAEVEYFEPPGVMPYFKASITDPELLKEFGMIHNFKEEIRNGWLVLKPAIDPQGKYHSYFWTCIMSSVYILLLDKTSERHT